MTIHDSADDRWDEHYRYLVEQAEDMLYLLDEAGRFVLVNDSLAELTGYAKDEIIGNTPAMLLSDEDLAAGDDRFRRLLEADEQEDDTWTVTLVTKGGRRIPCVLRFSRQPMAGGEVTGVVGVARDIRDRKRREQKLQVMTRVLRHNIRNKLGLVMGKADLLASRALQDDYELNRDELLDATAQIESTAEEMVRLSEKVRTIQERIHVEGEQRRTDVSQLGRAVVQQFRAEYPDSTITFDAPTTALAGVSDAYEVALSELVENGLVHSDAATPVVDVEIERRDGTVVTRVRDRCEPVPETEQRVIHQEEETALSHSAGVGLWLVHWVVTEADGDILFGEHSRGNSIELIFDVVKSS
jgi:PAS domain S-box-containing protein